MSTLHQLFAKQADKTPDRIAVVFEQERISYRELEERSTKLANRLRAMGILPNTLVALCVERSIDMVVGLLGILKAGGAYVPVDPAYPSGRINYMIENSKAPVIVTQSDLVDSLPGGQAKMLCLDRDWEFILEAPETASPQLAEPEDLAYVIYTSGSTGHPKGVEIPHRALVNFLSSMRNEPGLNPDDRLLAVTTLSFDIAGLELYLPLIVGARVVLASRSVAADGNSLARLIEDEENHCNAGDAGHLATPARGRLEGYPGSASLLWRRDAATRARRAVTAAMF